MNLEPIRALIKLAGDLENQICEGDGAYPQDYHDVHTSAVAALPALSQLLEAVTNLEKLEQKWRKLGEEGPSKNADQNPDYCCHTACADELKALLDREK